LNKVDIITPQKSLLFNAKRIREAVALMFTALQIMPVWALSNVFCIKTSARTVTHLIAVWRKAKAFIQFNRTFSVD